MNKAPPKTSPPPVGAYAVARLVGNLVHTAGMTPRVDGKLVATGRIGRDLTDAEALAATRLATERALAAVAATVPKRAVVAEVVSLTVYLAAADDFVRLSEVADAASAVIVERFPDADLPVRAVLGVAALPGDAPVEIQLIARFHETETLATGTRRRIHAHYGDESGRA